MANKVIITGSDKVKEAIKKKIENMKPTVVEVGILTNATYPGKKEVSVLDVAIYNEYGTTSSPPRPFMLQTKQRYSKQWSQTLEKLIVANNGDVKKAMELLGNIIKGQIQKTIAQGAFAPNAPSTVAQKGKNTPLRDSLLLFNSIDYEVK